MGHKIVCFECKKAFNLGTDLSSNKEIICSDCGKKGVIFPHRFRPPRKTDIKKWEVVCFLFSNGFKYHHIYFENTKKYVNYPENLREAKEFVKTYKAYAEQ